MPEAVGRRLLLAGAAWTVPVVLVGQPAAAAACSGPVTFYTPNLSVSSSTTTKSANGHTIGNLLFSIKNNGTNPIPAGTTYSVTITAEKAPGTTAKDVLVTARVAAISPQATIRFNPNGGGSTVVTKGYTFVLPTTLSPGQSFDAVWGIDSETGIGATKLRLDATLVTYTTTSCGETTSTGSTTVSAYWGAKA